MINKKNLLGKAPFDLGEKDAIHVAIVSVRAGQVISPGQGVKLNEYNEAIPCNGRKGRLGVADPFRYSGIARGEYFWLLLSQDAVPNVKHVWEHESVDFSPPTREVELNRWIKQTAEEAKVPYEVLMAAASQMIRTEKQTPHPDPQIEDLDWYAFWSEWSEETDYEFENYGSHCCPQYEYPDSPFVYDETLGAPANIEQAKD